MDLSPRHKDIMLRVWQSKCVYPMCSYLLDTYRNSDPRNKSNVIYMAVQYYLWFISILSWLWNIYPNKLCSKFIPSWVATDQRSHCILLVALYQGRVGGVNCFSPVRPGHETILLVTSCQGNVIHLVLLVPVCNTIKYMHATACSP